MTDGCFPDEDEENAFKKDVADDQLIIHDYTRFHSPDGKWMKLDTNPAFKFIFQGLSVRSKDLALPGGGLTYKRWKRESEDIVDYSGGEFVIITTLCGFLSPKEALAVIALEIATHDIISVSVPIWLYLYASASVRVCM